ncbi:25742_t:CDS:2, partial [Gigaspora margarita]
NTRTWIQETQDNYTFEDIKNIQSDQDDKVHKDTQYNYRDEDIQDNISNSTHDYIFEENIVASNENSEKEQKYNNNDNIYKTENEDVQENITSLISLPQISKNR